MVIRGIFTSWKLPIYFEYETGQAGEGGMDVEKFLFIVKSIQDLDLHVATGGCDMGTKNQGLVKKLGIDIDKTGFPNPGREGAFIYWLYDMPHMLKLMRNAVLDKGFKMEDGFEFGIKEFETLMNVLDQSEISIAPRLSWSHIHVNGQDRQRVRLAAQIWSESVALAFRHLFPGDQKMQKVSDIILAMGKYTIFGNFYAFRILLKTGIFCLRRCHGQRV